MVYINVSYLEFFIIICTVFQYQLYISLDYKTKNIVNKMF